MQLSTAPSYVHILGVDPSGWPRLKVEVPNNLHERTIYLAYRLPAYTNTPSCGADRPSTMFLAWSRYEI
jgi:hypothetical protein